MKKELVKQYALRVTQANQTQLVVILYEIIEEDLKAARLAYEEGKFDEFVRELKHAQKIVLELMNSLDCQYMIGLDLMSLYLFINKQIIQALVKRNPDSLCGLEDVILPLKNAFKELEKQDTSGPVMTNTEQVYAGLTYQKGSLSETYLDQNTTRRGFTV